MHVILTTKEICALIPSDGISTVDETSTVAVTVILKTPLVPL